MNALAALFSALAAFGLVLAVYPGAGDLEKLERRKPLSVYLQLLYDELFSRLPYVPAFYEENRERLKFTGTPEADLRAKERTAAVLLTASGAVVLGLFVHPALILFSVVVVLFSRQNLENRVKKYRKEMSAFIMSLAELVSVGVSAGLSPLVALEQGVQGFDNALAREIDQAVKRIKLDAPARQVFNELAEKVAHIEFRTFSDLFVQALEGGDAEFVMRLADFVRHMRDVRLTRLEEMVGKIEAMMLLPIGLVLLAFIIIIIAPLAQNILLNLNF